ncbi:uncharacterized protein LOC129590391 [Paramacrobiotus metropolitanus]|uniref:uncharacterized protein LOC129590391 n=1 Tax=Paramacrobiotus metropolitanus TaxID=2943436 RepID=UPI0024465AC4|nr:uncharacterized protein LOC129590391 [Paramacrobiotus metropolitanus]
MPRTTRTQESEASSSQATAGTQRTLRGRVRPQEASDDEDATETDSTPNVVPTAAVEVSEIELEWMEEGWMDLPPIPVAGGRAAAEENELESNATLLVTLILMCHHSRGVMTNNRLKNEWQKLSNRPNVDFEAVFKRSRKLLREDFGFVLAEISPDQPVFPMDNANLYLEEGAQENKGLAEDGPVDTQDTQKSGRRRKHTAIHYILINSTDAAKSFHRCGPRTLFSADAVEEVEALGAARHTLLTLTLLYIFMEGGDVLSDLIWNFLKPFGFDVDLVHPHLGKLKDLLQRDFVKQEYLLQASRPNAGGEQNYYRWGARADLEFSRLAMLDLCGRIFGVDADNVSFGERYNKATVTEKQRRARIAAALER